MRLTHELTKALHKERIQYALNPSNDVSQCDDEIELLDAEGYHIQVGPCDASVNYWNAKEVWLRMGAMRATVDEVIQDVKDVLSGKINLK